MNTTATFRILLAGVLAAIATIAVAQSSANFKSPAFSVNAGVGDMGSTSFNARASVGQPFDATGVGSAGFAMRPGLFGIPVAAGAPGISVQPLSLTFPATSAGTGSVKQTVTISNTTAAPVTIGATMNSPAEFGHFAPSCGSTIAAMGTCTIEVELAPAAVAAIGPVSGSLSVPTSGGNLSVALSGSVTAFNTSAAPATIGFPITFVSQTSASQVVTITNNGSGTANVGLINFSGTDAGQFAVLSNTCTPPLASLGTCTVTIRFAPTTDGAKTANLQFSYRGASLAVPVSGTAVAAGAPVFSPSATTLTFAPQTVATTSAAQTLTITNTGNAPLTISSSIVAGPFVLSSNNCATISPTASCAMSVTFAPLAPGAAAGALTITSNVTGSPHSITLAGTGNVAPGTYAYIANAGRANVLVVDTTSNSVVTTIDVGTGPYGVAVNAAGTRAYVSSNVTGTLAVIDTATNTVLTTILVGSGPFGVAVNSVGTRVYVANANDNNVSVIDTASNMVVATIGVGSGPYGVSLNPAGTFCAIQVITSSTVSPSFRTCSIFLIMVSAISASGQCTSFESVFERSRSL